MAIFARLCTVLSLALASAKTSFSSSHAQLEAKVTLKSEGAWHLGGFCLGQAAAGETQAAEIRAHVDWDGQQDLGETGPVMLVAFDARESHWGTVRDGWSQMPCETKLRAATMVRQLGKTHDFRDFIFSINVHQTSSLRDWHFGLLTCGNTEPAQLSLKLEAVKGALSVFEANTHFDTSSCPEVNVPWLEAAHDQASFWILLVMVLLLGCSTALIFLACRRWRQKASFQRFQNTATAGGAEPVIGRPCSALGEAKVVNGQVNQDVAASTKGAASPDSCV